MNKPLFKEKEDIEMSLKKEIQEMNKAQVVLHYLDS